MQPADRQQLETDLAYWQGEGGKNERERRAIAKIALVGLPISSALAYWDWRLAACGLCSCAMLYGMGMYMTWVRRGEFAENVREIRAKLQHAPH